jgi:hypothetical protein
VEDAAELDGGVESQSLEVCSFKSDTHSVVRLLVHHAVFSFFRCLCVSLRTPSSARPALRDRTCRASLCT